MNVFGTLQTHQRDLRQVQTVREAVERAMRHPLDFRADKEVVRQVARELRAGEDVVASQVSAVRLQAVNQMVIRVRDRAIEQGLTPATAARVTSLAGVQAAALATRDALDRARARQRARLDEQHQLMETFAQEQDEALMKRFEQSDEQLAHDFEEALREIAGEDDQDCDRPRMVA